MTRSIVTGAGGFIGSNLCDYLLSQGHEVIGIDNQSVTMTGSTGTETSRYVLRTSLTMMSSDLSSKTLIMSSTWQQSPVSNLYR